jgi:hypothetical protein
MIQIGDLAATLPAPAHRDVRTRAVSAQLPEKSTVTIATLQFLEHGIELGTQLEQSAPAVAPQVVAHIESADGSSRYPYHFPEMVEHLVPAMQGFAHLASRLPVLVAPGRHGIVCIGRMSRPNCSLLIRATAAALQYHGICWLFCLSSGLKDFLSEHASKPSGQSDMFSLLPFGE